MLAVPAGADVGDIDVIEGALSVNVAAVEDRVTWACPLP